MTLLPYDRDDVVRFRGQGGVVLDVRDGRVVVKTDDGIVHLTTEAALREQQPAPVARVQA